MKALSRNRVKQQAEKFIVENYNELKYETFNENLEEISQQVVAMMLYALMLHGYGETRLKRVFGWFVDVLNMPAVFGQAPSTEHCMKKLHDEFGIDFDKIKPKVEKWEGK